MSTMRFHILYYSVVLTTIFAACHSLRSTSFGLSIIHFSDFHARFEEISPNGGLCYEPGSCIGGIARLATIARRLGQIRPNALLLNAGDSFQGTLYYELFHGNITATFMNELAHDVMTLGNHDFDDKVSGLVSYVKQLKAPVVVTNIDISREPSMKNLYTNSTIIRKGDKDIGIIGVIYSDTDKISKTTGNLKFLNEVETVNAEAKRLKAKGVNIIIVLSHCGIEHDKIMANNCPDIDVIVGGHSHILLYNGLPPSNDIAYDKYPIAVTQPSTNRTVLIVHAGAFTKYIGDIRIIFNEKDEVEHWKGNPIYLDHLVKQDPEIVTKLQPWKDAVDAVGKVEIGKSRVFLNGSCSSGECNFANLITDAMVDKYNGKASIGFMSANSIQNSVPAGKIVYEDVYMTLPYNNTWDWIELQGKDLLQVLEDNVANSESNSSFVNYLLIHWSGLKVIYDLKNKESKVVDVKVRCLEGEDNFEALDVDKWYQIIVPDYLLTESFEVIQKKHRNRVIGKSRDIDNLVDYIKKVKEVDTKTEDRMIFI